MKALKRLLGLYDSAGGIGGVVFWLYLLHLVFWLLVALSALGFETSILAQRPLSPWPEASVLRAWWMPYCALLAAMLAPLFLVFLFAFELSGYRRRAILLRFPEPGFWSLIRAHGLGLALLLALSLASLSANRWLFGYLYELPERKFVAIVVGEMDLPTLPVVISGKQLRKVFCNDLGLPVDKLPKECLLPPDSPEVSKGRFSVPLVVGPYGRQTTVFLFHPHLAFMIVLYFRFCRRMSRSDPRAGGGTGLIEGRG